MATQKCFTARQRGVGGKREWKREQGLKKKKKHPFKSFLLSVTTLMFSILFLALFPLKYLSLSTSFYICYYHSSLGYHLILPRALH